MAQLLYFSIIPNDSLTDREWNMANTIIILICAHTNSRFTGKPMVIEPVGEETLEVFHNKLFFQEPLTEEILDDFKSSLERQLKNAFTTAKLNTPMVQFHVEAPF